MQNCIYVDYYLAVGTKKAFGVKLFFKTGEGKVYDMLLSVFSDSKGDFIL